MKLIELFKTKAPISLEAHDVKTEQMISLMELMAEPELLRRMETDQKNLVDSSSYFNAFDNGDDAGSYFSSEFNIRATAGRIKSTYVKEPWVFAAATLIAKTMSLVPFNVVNVATGEIDAGHPLNKKICASNEFQDEKTLRWVGYLDLVLGGNFFLVFDEYFNAAMQAPVETVTLGFDRDRRTIDTLRIWGSNDAVTFNRTVPYRQCVHMKLPNPFSMFYGLSLFVAASRPIIMDKAKQEFEMAFYLRGATNTGIIETTEDISKTRMQRLMRTFEAVYTGKRNWWRTVFLPKGSKWVNSGLSMTEMQHLEGLRENRLTLLATLGIPPSKVGIVQDVNRATAEIQDETFWVNTIKPLTDFVASSWNNSYLVKVVYGGQVRVEADYSGIEALNGSLVSKGEQAKAVESFLTINEVRRDILGYDELPIGDSRGDKFAIEIRYDITSGKPPIEVAPPPAALPDASSSLALGSGDEIPDEVSRMFSAKAAATSSQERVERRLAESFLRGFNSYHNEKLALVTRALEAGDDVRLVLKKNQKELARTYATHVQGDLVKAMERGFSFANLQAKSVMGARTKSTKRLRFRDVDQEAVDALRKDQEDGRRETLAKRSIENFVGFDDTETERMLDDIADGVEGGLTVDKIAADLREKYDTDEGQSSTIARTEVLSAVSEGIKWNHDVLGQVFSDVQKQWFHVGNSGHSRPEHQAFETEGAVESDYKWGGVLAYPRDPDADAGQTINCRCTMVSVIPEHATSNAEAILDRV
jgi:HK97 family phage portal protein